jgi:hypothetical protein
MYTKLDSSNPHFHAAWNFVMQGIQDRYLMLVEKYGTEELKQIFQPEDFDRLESGRQKSLEVKKVFASLHGTVIENKAVDTKMRSDGSYPLEALVQGSTWPAGIDVTKREQYLSDSDFQSVFRMSKAEFNQKDKFVRLRLKKEHNLF